MSETDGTPAVDNTIGEASSEAPAPSAERGDEGGTMLDYVQREFSSKFGEDKVKVERADPPEPEAEPVPETAADPEPQDSAQSPGTDAPEQEDLDPDHPDAPVEQSMEAAPEPEAEAPTEEQAAQGEDEDDGTELPDEVSTEELTAQPPKTRKRMKKLLQQRYELRQELEQAKPVMSFIAENDLGGEDVQMALGLTAALQRGDFKGFLEGVAPLVQAAQRYMGHALPPELQQQVDQGYVTQELAQQLSAQQAQAAWSKQQAERLLQKQQQAQQVEQQQQARMVMARAVTDWEGQVRQSDPDYAQKEPTIRRVAQALVAERGQPQDQAGALKLAQDAYDEANRLFQAARPAAPPVATRAAPSVGMTQRSAQPEPKSMLDAVKQGLAQARSA